MQFVSIENRRVQTGRERTVYTKSRGEISSTPEVNAATYVDLPRFDAMETFNNLGEE